MDAKAPLYAYQETAVRALKDSTAFYLADDPGLGKSRCVIEALIRLGLTRILIICPAIGLVSWLQQFRLWSTLGLQVVILKPGTPIIKDGPGVYLISYSQLVASPEIWKRLFLREWDLLCCDEAHALKTPSTKRTRAIFGKKSDRIGGLAEKAKRIWLLSGSPMPNNASEIWTVLRALFPHTILNRSTGQHLGHFQFQELYCSMRHTRFGWQVTGSRNRDQLHALLKPVMLRRHKRDVLTDLPRRMPDVDIPFAVNAVDRGKLIELEAMIARLRRQYPNMDIDELLYRHGSHLATKRRELGMMKAGPAAEWIDDFLHCGGSKIVVFAYHLDVIDVVVKRLKAEGHGVVSIQGSTSFRDRQLAIEAFQGDPAVSVMVGQISSMGLAITLTAASDCLIVEADWTPGVNEQAIARVDRLGQKLPVLARYAVVADSLDEQITESFRKKAREIAQIL